MPIVDNNNHSSNDVHARMRAFDRMCVCVCRCSSQFAAYQLQFFAVIGLSPFSMQLLYTSHIGKADSIPEGRPLSLFYAAPIYKS